MQKAVIFDLFGTLCKPTDPEAKILEEFRLSNDKYDVLERVVCGHKFVDWMEYLDKLIQVIGCEDNVKTRRRIIDIINEEKKKADVFPETKNVLEQLFRGGYKIGLISNAYPVCRSILEGADILGYFSNDGIFLSYEKGITKQDPKIFKMCLEELEVSARDAIMVGDSLRSDIKSSYDATNGEIGGILISEKPDEKAIGYVQSSKRIIVPSLKNVPEAVNKYFSQRHGN